MTDQPAPARPEPAPAPAPDDRQRMEMRTILAVGSTLIFIAAYAAKYVLVWYGKDISQAMASALGQFDGAALVQWAGVMGYYYGTSVGQASRKAGQ